jgi:RimJ/RimL family protein N-acetyltransferase
VVPIVETARLRLRQFRESDLDRWAAVMADPVTVEHFGGEPMSREETWRRLLMSTGLWLTFGYGYWAAERKEDGALVGQVGLADFKREMQPAIDGAPEAGWIFAPEVHGQGYASEAVAAMLEWADETLKAPEIRAIIAPKNGPSIRIAEKNGFSSREDASYKGDPILLFRRRLPHAS